MPEPQVPRFQSGRIMEKDIKNHSSAISEVAQIPHRWCILTNSGVSVMNFSVFVYYLLLTLAVHR